MKEIKLFTVLFFLFIPLLKPISTKLIATIITSKVLLLQTSEANAKDANYWEQKGDKDFEEGNYLEAINNYTKLLKKVRNSKKAFINRGISKARIGDSYGALIDLQKASKIDSKDPFIYEKIGSVYANELYEYKKSINYFTKSLELEPNSQIYLYRGVAHLSSGNYENGISDFKKSITLDNSNPFTYYYLSYTQLNMNNKQEAEALINIEKAIDLKNNEKDFYYLKGLIHNSFKDFAETCKSFKKSSDLGNEKFISERHQGWQYNCQRILNP